MRQQIPNRYFAVAYSYVISTKKRSATAAILAAFTLCNFKFCICSSVVARCNFLANEKDYVFFVKHKT